jgi:hypothetical protein
MNTAIINSIANYINAQSRNKIIFHSQDFSDFKSVNIGLRMSENIYNFKETSRFAMRVSSELNSILDAAIANHEILGSYLSIENLGILFEPELKIDFERILDNFSQNNVLFVKWDGEIDRDHIYFQTKSNGIKINIKNLSHIAI